MLRRTFVLGNIVLFLAVGTAMAADVTTGTWKLNLAKSKYDPANLAPKSSISKLEAIEGGIKAAVETVDAQGKPIKYEFTAKYDGKDYPVKGDPTRDMVSYKKIDDYTFDTVNKMAGKATTTTRTVYARDGKSRTITTTGVNAQAQKVNSTAFYDKQ
jgi:hypothetical protein